MLKKSHQDHLEWSYISYMETQDSHIDNITVLDWWTYKQDGIIH